jgi:hypothetical protein
VVIPADDLADAPADHAGAGRVDQHVAALHVLDEDGVDEPVDDGPEQGGLRRRPARRPAAIGLLRQGDQHRLDPAVGPRTGVRISSRDAPVPSSTGQLAAKASGSPKSKTSPRRRSNASALAAGSPSSRAVRPRISARSRPSARAAAGLA